jgi:hypothetical protein
MIEYRFRVPSAAVFTLYSYSKALEYRFRVPTAGSLRGPVHSAYNPRLFSLFFQSEQYFSLTTNQLTVFSAGLSAQPASHTHTACVVLQLFAVIICINLVSSKGGD